MVDIPLALNAISNAIKLVGDLRGIEREFNAAEYKLKIADLTTLLAEVKTALTLARIDQATKDTEIARLKAVLAKRDGETIEVRGYRYRKGEDGKPRGEPYCPVCLAKDGLLIQTTWTREQGRPKQCPNCKSKLWDVTGYID